MVMRFYHTSRAPPSFFDWSSRSSASRRAHSKQQPHKHDSRSRHGRHTSPMAAGNREKPGASCRIRANQNSITTPPTGTCMLSTDKALAIDGA